MQCNRRFTTYERMEETPLRVVKKDGSRVPFDRGQILKGMLKACEKRPVSMEDLEKITSSIERRLTEMFDREVGSKYIGQLVMEEMKKLDQVAYVRFASVYREFKDVEQFIVELKPFLEKKGGAAH
jgi:transcriptional repressor NrdR